MSLIQLLHFRLEDWFVCSLHSMADFRLTTRWYPICRWLSRKDDDDWFIADKWMTMTSDSSFMTDVPAKAGCPWGQEREERRLVGFWRQWKSQWCWSTLEASEEVGVPSYHSGNRSDAGLPWKQVKKLGFPPTTVEIAVMLVYLRSKWRSWGSLLPQWRPLQQSMPHLSPQWKEKVEMMSHTHTHTPTTIPRWKAGLQSAIGIDWIWLSGHGNKYCSWKL